MQNIKGSSYFSLSLTVFFYFFQKKKNHVLGAFHHCSQTPYQHCWNIWNGACGRWQGWVKNCFFLPYYVYFLLIVKQQYNKLFTIHVYVCVISFPGHCSLWTGSRLLQRWRIHQVTILNKHGYLLPLGK